MNQVTKPLDATAIESLLVAGDLGKLSADQRVEYYRNVCQSLGLNPLTKPFEYITLNGRLRLYALKDATEQLRRNGGISLQIKAREVVEDCYIVTARAVDKSGREDESIGAVAIGGLKGDARANAMMKAETKAKRRVTLSISGLGMLDETEAETIPREPIPPPPKPQAPPGVTAEKTALRERIRNLRAELDACEDADQWKALIESKPIADEVAKIRAIYAGAPDYWAEWAREFEAMLVFKAPESGPPPSLADEWLAGINARIDTCSDAEWFNARPAIVVDVTKNKDAVFPPDLDAIRAKIKAKDTAAANFKQKEPA